jgi:processive 1,2-diacylglycerol beta-glucosyltransferase
VCVLAKFLSCICFCLALCSAHLFAEEAIELPPQRKPILILSSTGGGGHTAACNTLQSLVGDEYDLKMAYPINQLRIWGVPSCEQVYNSMLRNGWIRSMNFIVRNLAPSIFRSYMGKLEKIVNAYIQAYEPKLVISVIPFVNLPASEAARKAKVPFLIITTDNDLRNWAFEAEKIRHPCFKVTIGADLPTTRDVLLRKHIPESAIETIGLPLRIEFMVQKNRKKILDELSLPSDKKIVLIMMGAAGGDTAYTYAKKVGDLDLNAHLIVIAGRNHKLQKQLERLELYSSNTMTVFGFTNRVADIMAVSNVIITKPGPGTINEAIAMKLPILIDNTDITLFWERANVDFVLKYGVGQKIKKLKQVEDLLVAYLNDPQTIQNVEKCFVDLPPNQFHLRIRGIIQELISTKPEWIQVADLIELSEDEEFEL